MKEFRVRIRVRGFYMTTHVEAPNWEAAERAAIRRTVNALLTVVPNDVDVENLKEIT